MVLKKKLKKFKAISILTFRGVVKFRPFFVLFCYLKKTKNSPFRPYKALEGPKMGIIHLWVVVFKCCLGFIYIFIF